MTTKRIYVLDTSVLLAGGSTALRAFAEHAVVLPLVVVTELERKRNDPELGWLARQVLHALEDLRLQGDLRSPDGVSLNSDGGSIRIELNHIDQSDLPASLQAERSNDMRIIAVTQSLAKEHTDREVVLVSRDLPMRLVAGAALGLLTEDYRNDQVLDSGYTGLTTIDMPREQIDTLYETGAATIDGDPADYPINTGVVLPSALATVVGHSGGKVDLELLKGDVTAFGMKPRSAEQRVALAHLLNNDIDIVSLGGVAGSGKTALALAAALEAVLERRTHNKIIVFRPLHAVGGQDLGFLPGTVEEKIAPHAAAIFDALESFCSKEVIEEVIDRKVIEVLPLTYIRGRTLARTITVLDESQNHSRVTLMAALSRLGEGSRAILTHDVAQRDNLFVGRHDGVASVVERLKGDPLFAHVTFTRSERSRAAEMVTRLLDGGD
jgi:PhoH-like ATPase